MSARYLPNIGSRAAGGGGGAAADRFAPTIIVGNTLAGDPATDQVAPFRYIPDPGDGTGIALALTEAAALVDGAWVHIRRGTYTLAAGVLPLAIPDNTRVTGDGRSTLLVQRSDDRRVFTVAGELCELSHIGITYVQAAPGATGTVMIDASLTVGTRISNLAITKGALGTLNLDESLRSIIYCGSQNYVIDNQIFGIDSNANGGGVAVVQLLGEANAVRGNAMTGGDYGVFGEVGTSYYNRLLDNIISGATQGSSALAGIRLGAGNAVCNGNLITSSTIGILSEDFANVINNNGISGGGLTSISLSALSGSNLVIGNSLGGGAVSDLGVANDVSHNV